MYFRNFSISFREMGTVCSRSEAGSFRVLRSLSSRALNRQTKRLARRQMRRVLRALGEQEGRSKKSM